MNTLALDNGPKRRPWALILGLGLLAMLAMLALALVGLADSLGELPVRVIIDGEEVTQGISLAQLGAGHGLGLAGAVLAVLAVLVVLAVVLGVVLPLVLLGTALAVGLALLAALGVPLLAVALVAVVAASPLILLVLLVRWLLRPRREALKPRAHSATMTR